MQNRTTGVSKDNRFAVIPHWVIMAGLSDSALRLYLVLTKYADNNTGQAWPSRATLAEDIGKSDKTVDRAIKELVAVDALKVTRRHRQGTKENYSNLYTVLTAHPSPSEIPDVIEVDFDPAEDDWVFADGASPMSPRPATHDAVTKPTELHPKSFTSNDESSDEQTFTSTQSEGQRDQPKRPYGIDEPTWTVLRRLIQATGKSSRDKQAGGFHSDDAQDTWETLQGALHDLLDDHVDPDLIDDLMANGKWTVGPAEADPYAAGTKLTKLLHAIAAGW